MQGLIDMHCHIVPGVDDGAADIETAARMLQMEYRNGVSAVIVTPHYRKGMFETPQDVIDHQFDNIHRLVSRSHSGMRMYLGCEYHTNSDMIGDLRSGKRPTMAGSSYVLTEFSSIHGYSVIRNQVYALLVAGYRPIIAHAERYPCLVKEPALLDELRELGAEIQLTSGSVLGEAGWSMKRFCMRLLKEKKVTYIASDAHDLRKRAPNLQECADYLEKKFGSKYAEQILVRNPRRIIRSGAALKERRNGDRGEKQQNRNNRV